MSTRTVDQSWTVGRISGTNSVQTSWRYTDDDIFAGLCNFGKVLKLSPRKGYFHQI